MITNYWIKDAAKSEVISKKQIPNNGNFRLLTNYYNLIDFKGLSFQFESKSDLQAEKLFIKNDFQYFVIEYDNLKELIILPNEKLFDYTENVASKIKTCSTEIDVLNLIIEEM
ncbi:MAG TPA: hypothetical protein PKV02_11110 [Bacteroidia bacterium]|nr:hypothetical protein [Bacteroidia bacterium]